MITNILGLALAMALGADGAAAPAGEASIPVAQVVSIDRQDVPGSDPGVLVSMAVKEGMRIAKGAELGRVDDREAKAQLLVKQLESDVADQEANSDIAIRFQQASSDVAQAFWEKLTLANKGAKGAVSDIEVQRAKLEWKKAELSIEKEREQNISNKLTAKAKKAEVSAAEVVVNRRVLQAPFDGIVTFVHKHPGEWVAVGEPVVEMVRVDRLGVRGSLDAQEWGAADVDGRKVTVEFNLPRGRVEKVTGKVVFVSPVVVNGKLNVWAEIETPMDKQGRPAVPAGMTAAMTVHTGQPAQVEAKPVSTPRAAPALRPTTKR
jgi:multidrug resistance efflux pump